MISSRSGSLSSRMSSRNTSLGIGGTYNILSLSGLALSLVHKLSESELR
jgi:hypothetical protein